MAKNERTPAQHASDASPDEPVLTPDGKTMLEARVRRLNEAVIPELIGAMRESDDLRETYEYGRAMGELRRLEDALARARLVDGPPPGAAAAVGLGDEVELRFPDDVVERFVLVHPVEAPLDEHRISVESPLGRAVLGREPGEEIEVRAPGIRYRCRLVRWDRRRSQRRMIGEILPA